MYTFTSNDLLQYVLNETTPKMVLEIEAAIITDNQIRNEVNGLRESIENVKNLTFSPKQKTMDIIFAKLQVNDNIEVV